MRDTIQPKYLDAKQAADYLGFSVHFIRDRAAAGDLKSYRPGRWKHYRFTREDLDAWMADRARRGTAEAAS